LKIKLPRNDAKFGLGESIRRKANFNKQKNFFLQQRIEANHCCYMRSGAERIQLNFPDRLGVSEMGSDPECTRKRERNPLHNLRAKY